MQPPLLCTAPPVQMSFMYGPLTRSFSLQSPETPHVPPPQAASDHIKEVPKKYKCDQCDFGAATIMGVRKHIKATHIKMEKKKQVKVLLPEKKQSPRIRKAKPKKYACDQCDFKTAHSFKLPNHIKSVHDKIKEYACDQCDHRTAYRGNLEIHIRTVHKQIKRFFCQKCDYKAAHNTSLKNHIKAKHDKTKDFTCDQCQFTAAMKPTLRKHIKEVHDKIKDYACDLCEYRGSRPNLLRQHVKAIHTKIKDIKCDQCSYVTGNILNLKYHVDHIHQKGKVLPCEECDFTASHRSLLARKEIPHWQTQKEETKIQNQVKGTDNIQGWKVFNETKEKGGRQAICIT